MNKRRERPVGYALIGCGAFGMFCLEQYGSMHSMELVAAADVDRERAGGAAANFDVEACSVEQVLERSDVDLVHVATPPFTHAEIVERALAAGKNVLCEKPLATDLESARRLVELARERELVLGVNMIMRYNPLCEVVKRVIDERLLGEPLHGYFENYAEDEPLSAEHWFWDQSRSGGIFMEHGAHFFDLFAWWLGKGRVMAAQQVERPRTDFVDQANCTAAYGRVSVNFYHGFTQAARMDRQEMRLLFERGCITLDEWFPVRARVDALADAETLKKLRALAPGPAPELLEVYEGEDRRCSARHKEMEVDGRYALTLESGADARSLYGYALRTLMADQLAAVADPGHRRRVDENNGLTALGMACEAAGLASDRLSNSG